MAKTDNFQVQSLSPAFWFICDVRAARASKGRGQISQAYASKAEAIRALTKIGRDTQAAQ